MLLLFFFRFKKSGELETGLKLARRNNSFAFTEVVFDNMAAAATESADLIFGIAILDQRSEAKIAIALSAKNQSLQFAGWALRHHHDIRLVIDFHGP